MDSAMYWRDYGPYWPNNIIAFLLVDCTLMLWICCSTTSQSCSIGLKSGARRPLKYTEPIVIFMVPIWDGMCFYDTVHYLCPVLSWLKWNLLWSSTAITQSLQGLMVLCIHRYFRSSTIVTFVHFSYCCPPARQLFFFFTHNCHSSNFFLFFPSAINAIFLPHFMLSYFEFFPHDFRAGKPHRMTTDCNVLVAWSS